MASQHYNWLSNMGMVCNKSKTEFIVFDRFKNRNQNLTLKIDQDFIKPVKTMKVLGVTFQDDLKWTKHISRAISSANSMFLPLKYVNKFLNRTQLRMAINAHFVSRLTFASPVWYKSISGKDLQRLNVNMNRAIRLILRDPKFKGSNRELYIRAGVRSLSSACTIANCTMLFKLCTNPRVDPLCVRLMSQCHVSDRFPDSLRFFDYSQTRVGRTSFINRAKHISELITFKWTNLSLPAFKRKIRDRTPSYTN